MHDYALTICSVKTARIRRITALRFLTEKPVVKAAKRTSPKRGKKKKHKGEAPPPPSVPFGTVK
eukprot:3039867-Karenia_brevis.AAC.1